VHEGSRRLASSPHASYATQEEQRSSHPDFPREPYTPAGVLRCIVITMGHANVVVDDALVMQAKRLYGLRSIREVIDLALRRLVGGVEEPWSAALKLEGTGWDGDLADMRASRVVEL